MYDVFYFMRIIDLHFERKNYAYREYFLTRQCHLGYNRYKKDNSNAMHLLDHDSHFNNIDKAITESWAAAIVLKNPEIFSSTIDSLSKIFSRTYSGEEELMKIIFKYNQSHFGKFFPSDVRQICSLPTCDAEIFAQKIKILIDFGVFLVEQVYNKEIGNDHYFLKSREQEMRLFFIVKKYREQTIFKQRGRGLKRVSFDEKKYLGIVTSQSYSTQLTNQMKNHLLDKALYGKRPFYHTRIGNENNKSIFVEEVFDKDSPLISSISGSTAALYIAANWLDSNICVYKERELAMAAIAYSVSAGYHSVSEVMKIACPNINYINEIKNRMSFARREKNYQIYESLLREAFEQRKMNKEKQRKYISI